MSEGTNAERITANNNIISANNSDIDAIKLRINNLPDTSVATATAGDIADGKTAFVNGQMITGSYTPPQVSLQSKDVSISTNGTTTITPDTGYNGLSDVDVTVSGILDTSDANATASDIAKNKTAYVNGQKITGNVRVIPATGSTQYGQSGINYRSGFVTVDTKFIENILFRENGNVNTSIRDTDLATVVGAEANKIKKDEVICGVTGTYEGSGTVSVPEKDVNFYDYDGTVVASYTASDFANLSALPDNPTHTGLTSQGWNWTLADAKTYVASYGKLNIGQMYVTDDGKTRIYIKLEEGRLEPYLGFAINGTATVDWGDNTTSTVTGTSTSTTIYTQHTYASAGNYVISIDSESDVNFIGDNSHGSYLLTKNLNANEDYVYKNAIQRVEFGSNVTSLGNNIFRGCSSLSSITIPNSITSIGSAFYNCSSLSNITIPNSITSMGNAFYNCSSLSSITIPNSITSIGSAFYNCSSLSNITIPSNIRSIGENLFYGCSSLSSITIPNSITSLGNSAFYGCSSLSSITIPNSVTNIEANVFNNCYGMSYYDFTSATAIPTIYGYSTFAGIPSDCKIVVPDDLYEDWIVANNWSTYASYIIKASDWT